MVAYTLVFQAVAVGTMIYSFGIFVLPWLDEFDATRAEIMMAIALLQIAFGLAGPFAGAAMDKVRMRNLVLVGVSAFVIGFVCLSFATKWWQVLLVYTTLFPLAMCLMGTLASQTLVTRWFREKRGLAIGISAMGTNLGGIVFPLVVAGALQVMSWRETVLWLAGAGALLVVPLTWLVLSRRSPGPIGHLEQDAAAIDTWATLRSRLFWVLVVSMVPLNVAFGAVQFNLGAIARDMNVEERAGQLIALCSVAMITGKLLFGTLSDHLRHQALFWIAGSVMLSALTVLMLADSYPLLLVGVLLVGLAGGGILPMMGIIVGARFALAQFGRVMGLLMLTLSLAALGPVVAGWLFDAFGSYQPAFALFIGLLLPGMVAMRWLPPPRALEL